MAIWLEIRCERRGAGRSEYDGFRCWSDDNEGPGVMSDDSQRGLIFSHKELVDDCKSAGWNKVRGEGWVCPACFAYEAKKDASHDN
ncbi:hypothetical protein GC087_07165 [Pantoea sp. JZ2]|uniref:hypothetical protein n=1 Tax=Pantoea sp. JZ2 TaxID=2654189 RepID=UPI002B496016|nr:hypothetical protein [Pantoea sp. JZ2]WRH12414.1 hypothetical protein GC087_07165 [Pantoea sp. JZ2]